jgi:flagellin-like protein
MKFNKKAVSPIIAAILLVVITITIGAGAIAFIRNLAESNLDVADERSNDLECYTNLNFDVQQICKDTTNHYVWAIVKNIGSKDIKFFRLNVIGSTNLTKTDDLSTGVASKDLAMINISYTDSSLGTIEKIELEPVIIPTGSENKSVYCSKVGVVKLAANVEDCS